LYDFGMLDTAKKFLAEILETLRPAIEEGIPLVGIEPSCLAVFRDELHSMFPTHLDAKRLRENTFTLAEFIEQRGHLNQLPMLKRKALVHRHCQHEAIMKFDADKKVLKAIGLDHEVLDSGCCGMAGAFGFERGDKYDVSIKAGERVLLPAVRAAPSDVLIVADGFSCREQIEQTTDRRALHLAQVIALARQDAPTNGRPEDACPATPTPNHLPLALAGAGALAVGALAWWQTRRNQGTG
jgi:Fe-S oxidoreductase